MKMFEIYMFRDQTRKTGDGGHIRFVAARDTDEATHKVAFDWGHWWRICGIREVSMDQWQLIHSNLDREGSAYAHSLRAYNDFYGIEDTHPDDRGSR